jgi:hypothetical protein
MTPLEKGRRGTGKEAGGKVQGKQPEGVSNTKAAAHAPSHSLRGSWEKEWGEDKARLHSQIGNNIWSSVSDKDSSMLSYYYHKTQFIMPKLTLEKWVASLIKLVVISKFLK